MSHEHIPKLVLVSNSVMTFCTQRNDCIHNLKEILLNGKTASLDLAVGVIFLSQSLIGLLGNASLLYHYFSLSLTEGRMKPTQLVLKHLFIANLLVILSTGIPQTIAAFGLKYFLNESGCDLLSYVQRVGRGVSITTTCILSVFQTIVISPMNSCWKNLKVKAPRYVGFSISLCWITHTLVNFIFTLYRLYWAGKRNNINIMWKRDLGYCSKEEHIEITGIMFIVLVVFPEVSLILLMVCSSGCMIFTLYRHKLRVQHIRGTNRFCRSPEPRATQRILILVSTFVSFYTISSIFYISLALFTNQSLWLVRTCGLISVSFPTISPFLLMSQDSCICQFCPVWMKNRKLSSLIINV